MDQSILDLLQVNYGKIIEINTDKRSQVKIKDLEDDWISPWLDIIFPFVGNDSGIFLDPAVGIEVVYFMMGEKAGFVFGSIYNKDRTLPGGENHITLKIDDKNKIVIDKSAKTITAQLDTFTIKGNDVLTLDSDTLIKIGESAASAIMKGPEYHNLINTLADVLTNHVHPVPLVTVGTGAAVAGLSTEVGVAVTAFKAGQSATLSTLSKVE